MFTSWLAGGAIIAAVAAVWGYIKQWFSYLSSFLIVTVKVEGTLPMAVAMYCWENMKRSPFGTRRYDAENQFIKPMSRYLHIGFERLGMDPVVFWQGWKPLFLGERGGQKSGYGDQTLTITYIRGMWNIDNLLKQSLDIFNSRLEKGQRSKRFYVYRYCGKGPIASRKGDGAMGQYDQGKSASNSSVNSITNGEYRILQWKADDIGQPTDSNGSALEKLAMPPEIDIIVEELQRWKESEAWYKQKSIPWRRGLMLYGKPGTGKTSLIRAIGQDMDLPVYTFDLASMSNDELVQAWKGMMACVPAIALFEDIDAVFNGRNSALGEQGGGLTFDCFLNVIGGVEKTDGVFTVITTNCVEKLDEALGKPTGRTDGTMISTRPGRIDRTFELKEMTREQRHKLASRLLAEYPFLIEPMVEKGHDMTGAQFQELCSQQALRLYWENKNKVKREKDPKAKAMVVHPFGHVQSFVQDENGFDVPLIEEYMDDDDEPIVLDRRNAPIE